MIKVFQSKSRRMKSLGCSDLHETYGIYIGILEKLIVEKYNGKTKSQPPQWQGFLKQPQKRNFEGCNVLVYNLHRYFWSLENLNTLVTMFPKATAEISNLHRYFRPLEKLNPQWQSFPKLSRKRNSEGYNVLVYNLHRYFRPLENLNPLVTKFLKATAKMKLRRLQRLGI